MNFTIGTTFEVFCTCHIRKPNILWGDFESIVCMLSYEYKYLGELKKYVIKSPFNVTAIDSIPHAPSSH